eukprot:5467157-Amphidinium_carterae.2
MVERLEPESYSRKTKLDQQMTQSAIQQRNQLVPKLIDSLKALQLWTMGSSSPDRERDRSQSSSSTIRR